MTSPAGGRPRVLRDAVAWGYCAFGAAMAVALVVLRHSDLAAAPVALAGIAAAAAAAYGRWRNRPAVAWPWACFATASLSFIVGAVLRQVLSGTPWSPLADIATMTGYAVALAAFVGLLRRRQQAPTAAHHELIDAAILLVATSTLALELFTVPTVRAMGFSLAAVVQGAYPVVDAIMVFVVILLSWTSAKRVVAFRLLAGSVAAMLVGDVGYAIIGTRGALVGSPLLDLPFVVAFTLFGAAALHPSMRSLSALQLAPVPAWSRARLAVIVPMLLLPPGVAAAGTSGHSDVVGAAGTALVLGLILLRAVRAVHDHARAEEGLRHRASHDPLTRLVNRPRLVELVDQLLARPSRSGHVELLFLDLDSFKLVNDTWGHEAGDRLLRRAAARLNALAGPQDLVARIGGDEFVLVRWVPPGGATGSDLAAQVVAAFRDPLDEDGGLITSVSIGLARSTAPGVPGRVTAESLLRDADTAMYRAKAAGRNRCMVFDPSMHDSVRQRVEIELALRYALDRRELELHYQPIVSLQTGEVVGAEALLRWAPPRLGMVPPLDFVGVAEETGLIVEIGEWVVSEALRQIARWRARPDGGTRGLWVSVNVSARQLRDPGLVDHVREELERHGVPPELLVLEITETAMMADEAVAADLLHRLRALGVTLAVDDFGTGYSSLGHLRRFPVTKVKVDREFVAGIEEDRDDAEIVRAVVAMALAMRLEVVAEGVETEGQRRLLRELGVQLGQGWHFGRPAPAEDCDFVAAPPAPGDRGCPQPAAAKSYAT